MGNCSIGSFESGLFPDEEVNPQLPTQTQAADLAILAMEDKSRFDNFREAHNYIHQFAKEYFDRCNEMKTHYREMKKRNEELTAENENLRQRINNDSEMKHRSHQSSSEDATSRNKRSDVLHKYKAMDGNTRRQAMEAFGKQSRNRAELWYRKDLTCRIFLTAYDLAERAKCKFDQQAIPKFFQCAPSVGLYVEESLSQATKLSEQQVSEEMQMLLSTESFKVACSSVLKEMAVSCDLTDLEEKLIRELASRRDQWREHCPWLPYLDDNTMKNAKMKNYIKECLRLTWRMVNLLPPLKIVTVDYVQGRAFDDFFEKEMEENKENAQTKMVCVWPALTDCDNDEVLMKVSVAIIPKPKNQPFPA